MEPGRTQRELLCLRLLRELGTDRLAAYLFRVLMEEAQPHLTNLMNSVWAAKGAGKNVFGSAKPIAILK